MEKKYRFTCERCNYSWLDSAEWLEANLLHNPKEEDYQNGFECPNCGEKNFIAGKEIEQPCGFHSHHSQGGESKANT